MTLSHLLGKRKPAAASAAEVPARARRKEARPGELLDAALELFVEKGFAATRSEEVAARAGVSKGTLFLYFPSKDELFKAVVRETLANRFTEWRAELHAFEGTHAEMLAHLVRMWWERVGATRASGITKLMMSEAHNFPELAEFYRLEVVQPGSALIRHILEGGVASGEFDIADIDYAVHAVVGPMIYLMLQKHAPGVCVPPGQPLDAERYVAQLATSLVRGFSAKSRS